MTLRRKIKASQVIIELDCSTSTKVPPKWATNGGHEQRTELGTDELTTGTNYLDGSDDTIQQNSMGTKQGKQPSRLKNIEP